MTMTISFKIKECKNGYTAYLLTHKETCYTRVLMTNKPHTIGDDFTIHKGEIFNTSTIFERS